MNALHHEPNVRSLVWLLNRNRLASFLPLILLLTFGCAKDKTEPTPEPAPVGAETSALTFSSPITAEVAGKVINDGKQKIIDHGFVYGYSTDVDVNTSAKISLGAGIVSGFFTAKISDIQVSSTYGIKVQMSVRAYVTDKSGTFYGHTVTAGYKGVLLPKMDKEEGQAGDRVVISGNFRGLTASNFKVSFDDVLAKIILATETSVTVEVPKGIPVTHGQPAVLRIQAGVLSVDPAPYFTIWGRITDINPKSGPVGTKVTFTGDNLPMKTGELNLYLGNRYLNWMYDGTYSFVVPEDLEGGDVKLSIKRSVHRVESLGFTITN
ncbi:MAG: IPT/TIG domain-containing protein [Bacteroidota bacterium]